MSPRELTTETPLRIAIVGGGIAGLSLAIPLARAEEKGAPISVHVYEGAPEFAEIGAGVAFGPNAQRLLAKLGLKDVFEKGTGVKPEDVEQKKRDIWFDVRRADGHVPLEESFLLQMNGTNAGTGNAHRADFLDALVRAYPSDKATFDRQMEYYYYKSEGEKEDGGKRDGEIVMKFSDGSSAEADVLIGCDGVKSRTRRCMFAHNPPTPSSKLADLEEESKATRAKYSGWVAYRGVVPSSVIGDVLGEGGEEGGVGPDVMWFGQGRHILHFPIRGGELLNIAMFVRDREGKRAVGREGPWSEDVPQSQILEDYKEFNETCKRLVKAVDKPSVWGIFETPELPWYAEGRVALSGDAAHATTPHQGSGAGQCIEDSFILAALLTHPSILTPSQSNTADSKANPASNADWKKTISLALQAYSHVRRPRAARVQRTSAEAGMLYEYELPGCLGNLEKIKKNLHGRMEWIWEWDEEAALTEAFDFVAAAQGSA